MNQLMILIGFLTPLIFIPSAGSADLKFETSKDNHVYYSGTIKISGRFEIRLDETSVQTMGKKVCFIPEGESKRLIPRDNDPRAPWFCFSNQIDAMQMLEVPAQEAGSCGFSGAAEIVISNYVVDKREGDVFDEAKLVTVIKHSQVAPLACN